MNKNSKKLIKIEIEYNRYENYILLISPYFGEHIWFGVDLYDCFKKLRVFLEKKDFLLYVNGARKNTWPSGFLRDSSNGLLTYLLDNSSEKKTLNIFDYSDKNILTYEEQYMFYKLWRLEKKITK